jgi:hypothetical protein
MKQNFSFGRIARRFCTALILSGLLSVPTGVLMAQTDTGRVTGTVTDATGSVIPDTTITLINADTGATQTMTSDSAGNFNFAVVIRGNYRVDATRTGFKKTEQSFALEVSQVQTIKFQLTIGGTDETVEVTDAAPIIDLSTSSTGTVLESKQIVDLPLNGRNFTQLALLVPGVTRGAYGDASSGVGGNVETSRNSESGGAALSANGLRQQANNFELDGVDNNESLVNTIVFFPPVEATQEFRVNTSVAAAEFGRAGGAIVQSSIKSGTNQFHGSAFFFDRDQIFDANPNYFQQSAKPTFHRTQFGGTLGGPVWRDHIFLFGDYQGLREKQPNGGGFHSVPTALMRTGNFSELLLASSPVKTSAPTSALVPACTGAPTRVNPGANGAGAIYDPLTCSQWNYNGQPNVIDPARINQAGLNYLNAFPLPNVAGATTMNNYYVNTSQTQRFDDFDVRADATLTKRDSVFVRYSYGLESVIKQSTFTALPAGYGAGTNTNHPRGVAAGYTHIFSPNIVNEFRYGYLRPYYAYINPLEGVPVSANLGIANANRNPLLGGGAAINGNGDLEYTGDGGPYEVPQKSNQFVDSVSITHGGHSLRFGANIMKREVKFFQGNNAKGYFGFARDFTGYTTADMLTGFTDDYSIGVASSFFDTKSWETGYFAQDDWKVTRRLTLNLGVRYDLYTHPYEQNNNQSNFDTITGTLLAAGQNGNSRALVNNNYNNIAPRFGFAYDLTGKGTSSLRGGYGIYYFIDRGGVANQLSENPDFNGAGSYQAINGYRITFTGQGPVSTTTPNNNSTQATGALPLPTFGQTVNRLNPVNSNLISIDPHSPTSMVQQWNLQLQQQLDHATSVNIAYVGTKADHLSTWFNLNDQILNEPYNSKLYPALSSIDRGINEGASNYSGLQIYLQRQMSAGLQFTAAYTWSHTLDDSGGAFANGGNIFIFPTGPNLKTNYGNSDQDERNVFNFSALANLPVGRGKRFASNIPLPLDYLIGGWQVNTIVTLTSGQPFSITSQQTTVPTSNGPQTISIAPANRADLVGPIVYTKQLQQWFNPSSFATAPAIVSGTTAVFTRPGTLGRNQIFGPGFRDMDLSLFKNFPIKDTVTGQFRAEAFNLTNTPAFTNPNGNLDNAITPGINNGAFGQINSTRAYSERQLELAFRVNF